MSAAAVTPFPGQHRQALQPPQAPSLRTTPHGAAEMLYTYMEHLRPFLRQADVNEIAINRPGELWIETASGWTRHEAPALTLDVCLQLARLIANFNNKAVTSEAPVLSASLMYGERVQVVIPPACEVGTASFTIRKPSLLDKTLDELEADGAFDECKAGEAQTPEFEKQLLEFKAAGRVREFLDLAVRSRRNIIICGATGSGKTTVTKSLIRSIPREERLVTLEDVHELFLAHHPNKVHLFYSRADEGGAKVTPKQALASCLRMKPDRILLAELRGDEAWEFIKSVNTGHPGSITTMHANGAFECFEQLTALIKDSPTGAHLDAQYIRRRLLSTVDVVLFYHRRRLMELYYDPQLKRDSAC